MRLHVLRRGANFYRTMATVEGSSLGTVTFLDLALELRRNCYFVYDTAIVKQTERLALNNIGGTCFFHRNKKNCSRHTIAVGSPFLKNVKHEFIAKSSPWHLPNSLQCPEPLVSPRHLL
jgi:hypothetical protein